MVIRKFGIAALLSLATLASASESGVLSYRAQRSRCSPAARNRTSAPKPAC